MEEELKNFILVWFSAIISVSYCYYLSHKIKPGIFRLISVLPVCVLFLVLPLFTSSVHLSLMTAMCLAWLANFKLILFSFDKGPLIPIPPNFPRFFCFACFPIKAQQNPKTQMEFPKWVSAIKVAVFGVVLHMYDYKEYMSPMVLLLLYSLHIYLELEIFFILLKLVFSLTLGFDLEPQSNEPLLATSLQDFWGRRWNLMVPAILRPVVYAPMRRVSERRVSSHWAMFPGILAAFFVSGVFHELLAFYLTREMPTGRFTMFFVLHGICTAAELAVKKNKTKVQLSPAVSRLLTVGFLFVTSIWLFAPLLVRNGVVERFTNEGVITTYFLNSKLITLLGFT